MWINNSYTLIIYTRKSDGVTEAGGHGIKGKKDLLCSQWSHCGQEETLKDHVWGSCVFVEKNNVVYQAGWTTQPTSMGKFGLGRWTQVSFSSKDVMSSLSGQFLWGSLTRLKQTLQRGRAQLKSIKWSFITQCTLKNEIWQNPKVSVSMLLTPKSLCQPGGHWTGEGSISTLPWAGASPVLRCHPPTNTGPLSVRRRHSQRGNFALLASSHAVSQLLLCSPNPSGTGGPCHSRTLALRGVSSWLPDGETLTTGAGPALRWAEWEVIIREKKLRDGCRCPVPGRRAKSWLDVWRWGRPAVPRCAFRQEPGQGQRRRVGHIILHFPACTTSPHSHSTASRLARPSVGVWVVPHTSRYFHPNTTLAYARVHYCYY